MSNMNKINTYLFILFGLFTSAYAATITGTVTYEKRINSLETSSGVQEDTYVALYGAKVAIFNDGSSTELASTTSGSDGSFTLEASPSGDYTIIVYAQNSNIEVGSSVTTTPITLGIYSKSTSGLSGTGPHSITISIEENSGAFNILHNLEEGIRYIENLGYSIPEVLRVQWPDSSGSYFEPDTFTMGFLSLSNDPDEWDDDVIFHEFGHAVAEAISIDHSQGGSHSLSGRHDMRLTWSEGLATYIGSAIQGDPNYRDSNGGVTGGSSSFSINYSIANPSSSQKETTNEVAISYVLYKAAELDGDAAVFSTIASFKNNSIKVNSEQATMDIFHDLWTGSDLSTYYSDRDFSYQLDDQLNNNVSGNAITLNETTLTDLTFYPDGASDFFKHIGSVNDVLTIETTNSKNGALTALKLYRKNGTSLIEIASNDQANGLSTDTTSKIVHQVDTTTTYIIEVQRFNSSTQNFGLGASNGYSKTAGTYGTYDLSFSYTRTVPLSSSVYSLDSNSDEETIESTLSSLLSGYNSFDLTSQIKAFGNVSISTSQRNFSSTDSSKGTSTLSVINSSSSSSTYTVSDDELPLTISNIPTGITAVIGLFPIVYETNIHELSREKIMTLDLLNGSDLYTGDIDLNINFTSANLNTRIHQFMKQGSANFSIVDDLMTVSSDDLLTNVTSAGVYSLRQLVNANASAADQQAQLASFINNNSIDDLKDELSFFHHIVNTNGDQTSLGYNSSTNILIAQSSSLSSTFSDTFNVDGNVTISGVPEDSVLIFTSLPKSYASSVPDNTDDQIYFYNIVSSGLDINAGFTLDVDFLDQGRNDFDYFLHKFSSDSFDYLSQISTVDPNLSFNITNDGIYTISTNVNITNSTNSTLTTLISDLLDNTNSVLDLTKSNQFASLISLGNLSINSNGSFITLKTISSANEMFYHSDSDTELEISGIPQGNTMLVITIPTSEDVNVPTNSASDIIVLNLYDNNSNEITSGFSLNVNFVGAHNTSVSTQNLYRLDESTGDFVEQPNISSSSSNGNLIFTMTSFSSYVLNNGSSNEVTTFDLRARNETITWLYNGYDDLNRTYTARSEISIGSQTTFNGIDAIPFINKGSITNVTDSTSSSNTTITYWSTDLTAILGFRHVADNYSYFPITSLGSLSSNETVGASGSFGTYQNDIDSSTVSVSWSLSQDTSTTGIYTVFFSYSSGETETIYIKLNSESQYISRQDVIYVPGSPSITLTLNGTPTSSSSGGGGGGGCLLK